MSEDSELPDDPPSVADEEVTENPFRPTAIEAAELGGGPAALPPYDARYWGIALAFIVLITGLTYAIPFLGPVVVGAFFAFFRVPLLRNAIQRRISVNPQGVATSPIASPLKMYFLSTAILTAAAIASSVAFVVICLPTSLVTLSFDATGPNDAGIAFAFGLGLAGALACFFLIFWTSLRLNS